MMRFLVCDTGYMMNERQDTMHHRTVAQCPADAPADATAPTISYCLSNVDDATRHMLQTYDGACKVIEECCLQRCGYCYDEPFLVVDDQLVRGSSHAAIFQTLAPAETPKGSSP
jgi:uncharacterized protein YuzB (UPF0349 family)